MDNQRLEQCINDWKVMAEKSESNVSRYCRGINKVFSLLEEAKLDPAYTLNIQSSEYNHKTRLDKLYNK